ncbi:MAG: hypothetical protein AAF092_03730 [Pseudomonadota bacterium]
MSDENFIPKSAPNYTNAFLTMMGALTFMSLWVVAGLFGFIWVILGAAFAEVGFRALLDRRS